jgi:iron-sulfur cluster repair protein YtfE (RIC family)
MLHQEKIQTLEQLVDMADRLEQVDGMEPRMAEVIREALARVAPLEEQTLGEMLLAPWCA